ncbi:hypothetical protein COOONC_20008 [Cooperia oncophora]
MEFLQTILRICNYKGGYYMRLNNQGYKYYDDMIVACVHGAWRCPFENDEYMRRRWEVDGCHVRSCPKASGAPLEVLRDGLLDVLGVHISIDTKGNAYQGDGNGEDASNDMKKEKYYAEWWYI